MLKRRSFLVLSGLLFSAACIYGAVMFFPSALETDVLETDILVYGSSLGGTSAAIVAAEHGATVVFATDSDVIGGQAVESGMSAFDDVHQPWEQWGLYADLQRYLLQKRGSAQEGKSGLGAGSTGNAASIPRDIEDFFRARIGNNPKITLLTGHTLESVEKERGEWRRATVKDTKTGATRTYLFRYLVDGTPTGSILARTETPTRIGFDTREETKEQSALPEAVRKAFVEGYKDKNGKQTEGMGNRVQSVAMLYALLDRGYPGDFYPPVPPQGTCWTGTAKDRFINDATIFASADPSCTLTIPVTPDFTDVYDITLIHHGSAAETDCSVTSPLWEGALPLRVPLKPDDRWTRIGAFYLEGGKTTTITCSPASSALGMEGVILTKRNLIDHPPIVLRPPFKDVVALTRTGASGVVADIYMLGDIGSAMNASLELNGRTSPLQSFGPKTLKASNVLQRNTESLRFSGFSLEKLSAIIIIPTKVAFLEEQSFRCSAPDRSIPPLEAGVTFPTDQPVLEWRFSVPKDEKYLLQITTDQGFWRHVELLNEGIAEPLLRTNFNTSNVSRNGRPLLTYALKKNVNYLLRMSVARGERWDDCVWTVAPLSLAPVIQSASPSSLSVTGARTAGVHDIWIRGPIGKPITLRTTPIEQQISTSIRYDQFFHYAGKAYLDPSVTLEASAPATELLAIPNPEVDVFSLPRSTSASTISRLPAGRYRSVTEDANTPQEIGFTPPAEGSGAWLPFPVQKNKQGSGPSASLVSRGFPLSLAASPPQGIGVSLLLFEEIPDLTDTVFFSLIYRPLFLDVQPGLFLFRNIIAPQFVLDRTPQELIPPHVGTNTLGMALVAQPSNDYSPVIAEEIDNLAGLKKKASALSAAYAYWTRYDATRTEKNFGCSASLFPCHPKRAQPVIGFFSDALSLFPPLPYIREGRRLVAKTTVSQNDLLPAMERCVDTTCPKDCTPLASHPRWCLSPRQEPTLFPDALAAVGYGIDLHTFTTPAEYFARIQSLLELFKKELGDLPTPLSTRGWLHYYKPAEVPLGMLIPAQRGNVFAAGIATGVTQIANGLFRTHVNELAVGQSLGGLLAFCLREHVHPFDLTASQVRQLQHELIERDTVLYPIKDMMGDSLLRKGSQLLILDGLLKPKAVTSGEATLYKVEPDAPLTEQDGVILQKIFDLSSEPPPHLAMLLRRLFPDATTDAQLLERAIKAEVLAGKEAENASVELLQRPLTRGDVYRAAAFFTDPGTKESERGNRRIEHNRL